MKDRGCINLLELIIMGQMERIREIAFDKSRRSLKVASSHVLRTACARRFVVAFRILLSIRLKWLCLYGNLTVVIGWNVHEWCCWTEDSFCRAPLSSLFFLLSCGPVCVCMHANALTKFMLSVVKVCPLWIYDVFFVLAWRLCAMWCIHDSRSYGFYPLFAAVFACILHHIKPARQKRSRCAPFHEQHTPKPDEGKKIFRIA